MSKIEFQQGKESAISFCSESDWLSRAKPVNPYVDIKKYIAWENGFEEYFMNALDALDAPEYCKSLNQY
jgi:hypothetical protein